MTPNAFEILGAIMQWVIAPVAAFVWLIYVKQQTHSTQIAVLQAEAIAAKIAHDREIREIKETANAIFSEISSIEEALRK